MLYMFGFLSCSCVHCTGIGPVLNLRFNPSFSQVLWDPPSTAGVLSNLYYYVTLMNNVSSDLILNETTNNTYCPLAGLQPCQYYIANVTAFSSEYHGDSAASKQRITGGMCVCTYIYVLMTTIITCFSTSAHAEYYTVQSMSQDVVVNPDGVSPSVVVLVALNLKVLRYKQY